MKFTQITPEEFRAFADKSQYKSFMQTPEIATLRERKGWTPYYFGVESNAKLLAAAMLVAKPTFLGKSTYFCPGGPLLDLENEALTNFFFAHLKKYIKSHNGYILLVDPYYELIERDRDGNQVENGFNHTKAKQNLKNLGLIETHSTQPKYFFAMDLQGRTEAQLLADLKRNTRNHIKKAEKKGVVVRELEREELNLLKEITESTSKRRHFEDRPLSYYEQMYDLFAPRREVKFLVAECELGNDATRGLSEVTTENEGASPVTTGASDPSRESTISSSHSLLLSAAMFMLYGEEVVYLFSGSEEQYMKEYNAQYAIQWHMIKYAATHGFKRYNFYGISGLPHHGELDGIYEFKKGFDTKHGKVIELIGSYELPINQPFYQLHRFLAKLR